MLIFMVNRKNLYIRGKLKYDNSQVHRKPMSQPSFDEWKNITYLWASPDWKNYIGKAPRKKFRA